MKHILLANLKIFLLLLLLGTGLEAIAVEYPAEYRVTTNLNIRKGPGTGYAKAGTLKANERITIYSVVQGSSMDWGEPITIGVATDGAPSATWFKIDNFRLFREQ